MTRFMGVDVSDRKAVLKRLVACLFGGFVLALMVGNQEGSQTDFGISFRQATSFPRLLIFLGVGLVLFVLVSFAPQIMPYVRRPGFLPLGVGFVILLVSMELMNWYDPVGKFGKVANAVSASHNVPTMVNLFFGWFAYVLWIVPLAIGGVAIVMRKPALGWVTAALGVLGAIISFVAHAQLVAWDNRIDHGLAVYAALIGYLTFAVAGVMIARAAGDVAHSRDAVEEVMSWRPGLPIVGVGVVLGLIALFDATWFSPLQRNDGFRSTRSDFQGTGVGALATNYLAWLGYVLFAVTAAVALAACLRRWRVLAWVAVGLGVIGLVLTLIALHDISATGARVAIEYGKTWQNLGAGGWVACIAFSFFAVGGFLAARPAVAPRTAPVSDGPIDDTVDGHQNLPDGRPNGHQKVLGGRSDGHQKLPVHAAATKARTSSATRAILPIALVLALLYPPTLPLDWQSTIVTQIGPYILLTVGLNVVVGWAGLLDLGYIAFYGIGSYTTAYIVGSLPVKPPSWLHLSPLWAIPFAIVACLIAGVLLGAPTLRLRGDYLAIVTLGFGEIIQLIAINADTVTGGPQGPNVPPPVLAVGPLNIHWGLDSLPYWYLLLIFIAIMVILFYRLEGSRLGRAWAAIREDEVAAQATGINTTKAKLLAFAIGASTSGLAGVFFATQVGYFDPSQFTIQNSILIVAYVVFGGMGSLPGAIAGAAVLTWLPQFLKAQVPLDDRQMWIGALVLLMMIFRPAGLIPAKRRAAELHGLDAPATSEVTAVPVSEGV